MSDRVRSTALAAILLRLALAAGFLSAVADQFGLWGPAGTPGVAWGGFDPFLAYAGKLLWYLPPGLVPADGWAATVLEGWPSASWRAFGCGRSPSLAGPCYRDSPSR